MLGLSVGVSAQSFLSPEDAVEAVSDAMDAADFHSLVMDVSNDPTVNPASQALAEEYQVHLAGKFLEDLRSSIKTFSDTQTGYDQLIARLSNDTNGNAQREAFIEVLKPYALSIIAN